MTSRHLSLRLEPDTLKRLDAQSRRAGLSRSDLARTLLDEGLRMDAHPGIVFRDGPAGRRPGLVAGPDVWEVARVLRDVKAESHAVILRTAELMGLTPAQVQIAARYYADYRDEIDAWLQQVDEDAAAAEAAWQREQDLLRR